MRLGIDPVRINAMRRAGELYAVRRPGSQEYRFPAWQFGPDLKLRPSVERVLAAAREAGIDEPALEELLNRRVGVVGTKRRLLDVLVDGDVGPVLEEIRRAPRR
jgi:hypothetical protein